MSAIDRLTRAAPAMTLVKAFDIPVLVGMPIPRHATCTVTRKRLMDHRRGLCCPGLATNARWELFQALSVKPLVCHGVANAQ